MEQEQIDKLTQAFKAAVSLAYAQSDEDNKTPCTCFDIKPFNPHWDKKTVQEVREGVQRYVRSWIVSPIEIAFGLRTEDASDEMMLQWYQSQVAKLKNKIALKK